MIYQLGILRTIEIFSNDPAEDILAEYNYLHDIPDIQVRLGSDFKLIGLIDNHQPVITPGLPQPVFTLVPDEKKYSLIQIADTLENLQEHLKNIILIWEEYKECDFLPANDITKGYEKMIITDFTHKNPSSDPDFWKHYAFRELHTRFI